MGFREMEHVVVFVGDEVAVCEEVEVVHDGTVSGLIDRPHQGLLKIIIMNPNMFMSLCVV
jgi:hypothetical protein